MATSSFFYGGSPGPDQTTVNELVAQVEQKVVVVQNATAEAQLAATLAASSAASADASASAAAGYASEAAALISHFTISTQDPSGGVDGDVWFKII